MPRECGHPVIRGPAAYTIVSATLDRPVKPDDDVGELFDSQIVTSVIARSDSDEAIHVSASGEVDCFRLR
jgi:hypothetical protein